jgi:hypothetical protein
MVRSKPARLALGFHCGRRLCFFFSGHPIDSIHAY